MGNLDFCSFFLCKDRLYFGWLGSVLLFLFNHLWKGRLHRGALISDARGYPLGAEYGRWLL